MYNIFVETVIINNKKSDVRYIRAEDAITNAFLKLVSDIGFYAITVKDITNLADVSRGTFYQHYDDKYDKISFIKNNILNCVSSKKGDVFFVEAST